MADCKPARAPVGVNRSGATKRGEPQMGDLLCFENGEDLVQPPAMLALLVGDLLEIRLDLVEANTLAQYAATHRANVLAHVVDHVVDGMHISIELGDLAFNLGHRRSLVGEATDG
jgi:hypothetical protein